MIADQWEIHIKDSLHLASSSLTLVGGIQINCNNQHCAIRLDPEIHINYDLPLAGSALSLARIIPINGNNTHCSIYLDLVLKIHDLYGR